MSDELIPLILFDINQEIADVESFIIGLGIEQFLSDRKTQKAVAMSLQVLGESAGKLPLKFTDKHPSVEWHKIAGLRNRISHDYAGLDMELIWQIITIELPVLKIQLQKISTNHDSPR